MGAGWPQVVRMGRTNPRASCLVWRVAIPRHLNQHYYHGMLEAFTSATKGAEPTTPSSRDAPVLRPTTPTRTWEGTAPDCPRPRHRWHWKWVTWWI